MRTIAVLLAHASMVTTGPERIVWCLVLWAKAPDTCSLFRQLLNTRMYRKYQQLSDELFQLSLSLC